LQRFYVEVNGGRDRLEVLRAFAELAIVRPAEWDPDAIRARAHEHRLHAEQCGVCLAGDRVLSWHHIIQIQHGGSNTFRNRIALCASCHADIHPWLPTVPRRGEGWSRFSDLAGGDPETGPKGFTSMRTWRTAWRPMHCGSDPGHVIAKGAWYLEIEIGSIVKRARCQACAVARFGEPGPPSEPPAPVEQIQASGEDGAV
jgi:hypothetical protein